MRHPPRDPPGVAAFELEPLPARLNGKAPLEHDVGLVLWMGVKRRRGVMRKEKLDQRKATVDRLARDPDRCQSSDEPERLALAGAPRRRHRARPGGPRAA